MLAQFASLFQFIIAIRRLFSQQTALKLHTVHTTSEIDFASDLLMPSESLLSEPCINLLFFFILDLPLNYYRQQLINSDDTTVCSPIKFWCAVIETDHNKLGYP